MFELEFMKRCTKLEIIQLQFHQHWRMNLLYRQTWKFRKATILGQKLINTCNFTVEFYIYRIRDIWTESARLWNWKPSRESRGKISETVGHSFLFHNFRMFFNFTFSSINDKLLLLLECCFNSWFFLFILTDICWLSFDYHRLFSSESLITGSRIGWTQIYRS
jgi:hypothetical protein